MKTISSLSRNPVWKFYKWNQCKHELKSNYFVSDVENSNKILTNFSVFWNTKRRKKFVKNFFVYPTAKHHQSIPDLPDTIVQSAEIIFSFFTLFQVLISYLQHIPKHITTVMSYLFEFAHKIDTFRLTFLSSYRFSRPYMQISDDRSNLQTEAFCVCMCSEGNVARLSR